MVIQKQLGVRHGSNNRPGGRRIRVGQRGWIALLSGCCLCLGIAPSPLWAQRLEIQTERVFGVTIEGQPFTTLELSRYGKPICFPIFAPGQVPMTRSYPMVEGVAGEATDHRHHKSLWFAHGDINGVSFWDDRGEVRFRELLELTSRSVTFANDWLDADGRRVCTDRTTIVFGTCPDGRTIDWDVTMLASDGKLVFGDTKEGMMAVRTHPNLRLSNDPRRGVTSAVGRAVNSEGATDKQLWGKRAKWVDYSGEIDGQTVGIAILDHPENLRHPTYWHAREYGLVAANPFGRSYFEGSGNGDHEVPAGESIRFRYRFVFHTGDAQQAQVEQLFEQYAQQP